MSLPSIGRLKIVLILMLICLARTTALTAQGTITLRPSLYTPEGPTSLLYPQNAIDTNPFTGAYTSDWTYCNTMCTTPKTRVTNWWGFPSAPANYVPDTLSVKWDMGAVFGTYSPDTATATGLIEYSLDNGTTWQTLRGISGPPNVSTGTIMSTVSLQSSQDPAQVQVRATTNLQMTYCLSCSRISGAQISIHVYDITLNSVPKVANPVLTPSPGTYYTPQIVSATTTTPEAFITYTMDGSDPTDASPRVPLPQVTYKQTFRVRAFRAGWVPSDIVTATYDVRHIVNALDHGVVCDGLTNDTQKLNDLLAEAQPGDYIELPSGTCNIDGQLQVTNKTGITISGAGMDSTVVTSIGSACHGIYVNGGQSVTFQDMQVSCPNFTDPPDDDGFWAEMATDVNFYRVKAYKTYMGIHARGCTRLGVYNSHAIETRSSGVQIDGVLIDSIQKPSSNVTVRDNYTYRTGDDGYATVGYDGVQNQHIGFYNNTVDQPGLINGGGITVGGSQYVEVHGNTITNVTRGAGLRVEAEPSYGELSTNEVDIYNNTLQNLHPSNPENFSAILVYSKTGAPISNVHIHGNRIDNPNNVHVFYVWVEGTGSIGPFEIQDNATTDANGIVDPRWMIDIRSGACCWLITGNTLNGTVINYVSPGPGR